jgi:glutathione S-transferase
VKATKEAQEYLRILEEHGLGEKKFFGGNEIGLTDLAFGWMAFWLQVLEEAARIKVVETDSFPRLQAWMKNFREVPAIRENLPDRNALLAYFKRRRESFIST